MREIRIPGVRRLLRIRTRDRLHREIEEEIRFHIESRVEELVRLGVSRDEARRAAEREYGDAEASCNELLSIDRKRWSKDQREEVLMSFIEDIRYAARGFTRRPALLTVTTTALCIGIAANAVMFGVVDQLLLRPPAHVVAPEGVKRLYYQEVRNGETLSTPITNYALIASLKQNTTAFTDIAAFFRSSYTLGRGVNARSVDVQLVSGNYFRLLGVSAALGRTFASGEDTIPQGVRVAVLSHGFWQGELGGTPDVLGRRLYVHGNDYVVIGVAPQGFSGIDRVNTDLWVPISAMAPDENGTDWYSDTGDWWVQAIGRLRADGGDAVAASQSTALFRAQVRELHKSWRDTLGTVVLGGVVGTRTPSGFSPEAKVSLWLMGVSIVVLLIACANVTNLLIARMLERRREIAVRLALGVSRGRLLRMLLAESALLAVIAALAALVLSYWASRFVQHVLLPGIVWSDLVLDGRVLLFTLVVTLLCIILAGTAPALQSMSVRVADGLKAGARQVAGTRSRLRHALLAVQAALSVVLLIGAGLFVRSLRNVTSTDVGIDLDRVLLVTMDLARAGFRGAQREEIYSRAHDRVRALPGVQHAAIAKASVPMAMGQGAFGLTIPGVARLPELPGGGPYYSVVSADFFATLGARIVRGRNFTAEETRLPTRAMIINEMIAQAYFPGQNPVGKCVRLGDDTACTEIVGVVQTVMLFQLVRDERAMYYLPSSHPIVAGRNTAALLVRANNARAIIPLLRSEIQQLAPNMPFVKVQAFTDLVAPQLRPWRLGATMFTLFGAIALVIAAVGLYSVMAYWVSQRTQEIGVRMALGARRADIVRLVAWQSSRAVGLGLLLGTLTAVVASRWASDMLYETSPRDPLVYACAALALVMAAVLASALPTRRSTAVDPAVTLRTE